jgi:hypothetical protein
MRNKSACLTSVLRIGVLLGILAFARSSWAQQYDFQIMVSGPWDFVADPNPSITGFPDDRIVLVAPAAQGHMARVFSGVHANDPSPTGAIAIQSSSSQDLNLYYIDFYPNIRTSSGIAPDEEPIAVYTPARTVPSARIQSILYSYDAKLPRYAISLPMPDYVSTYTGHYGSGFAEAKIGTGSVTHATPKGSYTTWMVLHYTVAVDPASTSISLQRRHLVKQPVQSSNVVSDSPDVTASGDAYEPNRYGASVSLMDPSTTGDDRRCDKLSGLSFSASVSMWHLQEHARFPIQLDMSGTQNPGNYDFSCGEYSAAQLGKAVADQKAVETINNQIITSAKGLRQLLPLFIADKRPSPEVVQKTNDDIKAIRNNIVLVSPVIVSAPVVEAMNCTDALVNKSTIPVGCPQKLTKEVITKYFGSGDDGDGMVTTSTGSADCHKAQFSINNAVQP